MLLDRGRGSASPGQGEGSGATKSGISFLLFDIFDYSLAASWLSLTFVADFFLFFISGPAFVASGQPFM